MKDDLSLKINVKNLTKEERKQLFLLVEKANKKRNKWKPNWGEPYFYIMDDGSIKKQNEYHYNYSKDYNHIKFGNCFKTEDDAWFMYERLDIINKLQKFAEEHNDKNSKTWYHLVYREFYGDIVAVAFKGGISFSNAEIAYEAINTIGEDRLKKYYFIVNDSDDESEN